MVKKNGLDRKYFTTQDGCEIVYKIDGEVTNPVLVLSNSIATDLAMWDGQVEAFCKSYRLLRFDTRGHGLSESPVGDYSVARLAKDVIELMDYLGIEKAHFCGLSLGGFIGQWLGVHVPHRLDKLILANTSPYLGPDTIWNENIHLLRNGSDMSHFEELFINGWFPKQMINNQKNRVVPFRKMILSTSPIGLAGAYAAVRDADFRKTNALIPNKTLILAGEHDQVTKPEHSKLMHEVIRGATLKVLPVVHLSNIERINEFERLVLQFLSSP